MNKGKWEDLNIPLHVLALKLCEEAAEVGAEITDAYTARPPRPLVIENVVEELRHVEFIVKEIRRRVTLNGE